MYHPLAALALAGEPEAALRAADRALAISRARGSVMGQNLGLSWRAMFHVLAGDVEDAENDARAALGVVGDPYPTEPRAGVLAALAWALTERGEPAEAEALLASGETFTARKMVRRATGKAYKQFVQARALDEGVPGLLRAFVLASFHFYVWACFWQLSGGRRTPEDDRYLRRLGRALRVLEVAANHARAHKRLARRFRARGRASG